jgi:hypothetical protein
MVPLKLLLISLCAYGAQGVVLATVVAQAIMPIPVAAHAAPNFTIPTAPTMMPTHDAAPVPAIPAAADAPNLQHYMEFSITIGIKGKHCIPGWINMFGNWLVARAAAGFGSLEVGKKQEHLHIQAIARVAWDGLAVSASQLNALRNQIKASLGVRRADGSGCTISIAPFAPGQTWQPMLGYVTKDEGKSHYRCARLNVTDAEIAAGKTAWATCKLSYEEDRLVLTKKNLFQALFASV